MQFLPVMVIMIGVNDVMINVLQMLNGMPGSYHKFNKSWLSLMLLVLPLSLCLVSGQWQGRGAEVSVSCIFWWYSAMESCLRCRERCGNCTMGEMRRVNLGGAWGGTACQPMGQTDGMPMDEGCWSPLNLATSRQSHRAHTLCLEQWTGYSALAPLWWP